MQTFRQFQFIGPKARGLFRLLFTYLLLFSLFRLAFFVAFRDSQQLLPSSDIITAFVLGLRFDLRVSLYLILPLAFFGLFPPTSWTRSEAHKKFWLNLQTFLSFLVIGVYFVDFGYFSYLNTRLSASVGQFFLNPLISLQMLWESYPLPILILSHLALTGFCWWAFRKWVFQTFEYQKPKLSLRFFKGFVFFFIYILGVHGSLSQYPLRWSEAFFSTDNFTSHLSLNPAHYLWDTYSNHNTSYDLEKTKKYFAATMRYLTGEEPTKAAIENLDFTRTTQASPKLPPNTNIIYIVMESYTAYKMTAFGNVPGASVSLDTLAASGYLFSNFYTPTEGTARSMFCTLTGLPDINAESTSSRNPLVVSQNTLMNALKNHDKYYFIGGSANWGNIRGIYENNIQNLKLFEEKDFQSGSTDVWGLNDLDLFREAAKELSKRPTDKPFFALIQAASFHRPYTIPEDHGDFQLESLSDAELKTYGWRGNEEYNSFRFSDFALGEFIRLIQDKDFFQNTLVVIHGDHGLPPNEAEHLTAGERHFMLTRFHVPLVFYSPLIKEPKVYDRVISQPDVMPSLMGLLGLEASHRTLGRNVFLLKPEDPSYAFSYAYYDRPVTKMLYDEEYLVITDKTGEVSGLYKYEEDPTSNLIQQEPDRAQRMSELLHGLYESSRYLIHHNKPIQ